VRSVPPGSIQERWTLDWPALGPDDLHVRLLRPEEVHEVGGDEAAGAGDEDPHR
jgi:hypothetical protein